MVDRRNVVYGPDEILSVLVVAFQQIDASVPEPRLVPAQGSFAFRSQFFNRPVEPKRSYRNAQDFR